MTLKPEQSFRSHRWSPIAVTETSVISSCILRIAANPVLRRVHLRAIRSLSHFPWGSLSQFPSHLILLILFCHQEGVFLPNVWLGLLLLLSSLPCRLYRWNRAYTKTTSWQTPLEHWKKISGFSCCWTVNTVGLSIDHAFVQGMMLCGDSAQRKRLEMRLFFQLGTSQRRCLNSNFRFL